MKRLLTLAITTLLMVAFVTLAWAIHDAPSKRLGFDPIVERHLTDAAAGRDMRAVAKRFCPFQRLTFDCTWLVTFYAKNPDGTEEELANAVFSTDPETTALGCLLKYSTMKEVKDPDSGQLRDEVLVDRFFADTICAEENE